MKDWCSPNLSERLKKELVDEEGSHAICLGLFLWAHPRNKHRLALVWDQQGLGKQLIKWYEVLFNSNENILGLELMVYSTVNTQNGWEELRFCFVFWDIVLWLRLTSNSYFSDFYSHLLGVRLQVCDPKHSAGDWTRALLIPGKPFTTGTISAAHWSL